MNRNRVITKLATLHQNSWQSPAIEKVNTDLYSSSEEIIKTYFNDYKRERHGRGEAWEREFTNEVTSIPGSKSYLFNSGMAALSSTLIHLKHSLAADPKITIIGGIYFETRLLVEKLFGRNIIELEISDPDLMEKISESKSEIVLAESLYNNSYLEHFNLYELIDVLENFKSTPTCLLLDCTCRPYIFLKELESSKKVSIFVVESLLKYWQYGLDLTSGGVLLTLGDKPIFEGLHQTRAHVGSNIGEANTLLLPKPNKVALINRLNKMSLNAETLFKELPYKENLKITFPSTLDNFKGSHIAISTVKEEDSILLLNEIVKQMLKLSKEEQLPLVHGASFGFDISRIYIISVANKFQKPFLRISLGIEELNAVTLLSSIIRKSIHSPTT